MGDKRSLNNTINECCSNMKKLKLSVDIQPNNQQANNIKKVAFEVNTLNNKLNNISESVLDKFKYLEINFNKKINTTNDKLDKLINLITNISDTQLYINKPTCEIYQEIY